MSAYVASVGLGFLNENERLLHFDAMAGGELGRHVHIVAASCWRFSERG